MKDWKVILLAIACSVVTAVVAARMFISEQQRTAEEAKEKAAAAESDKVRRKWADNHAETIAEHQRTMLRKLEEQNRDK